MHGIVAMANCPEKLPNLKLIVRLTITMICSSFNVIIH